MWKRIIWASALVVEFVFIVRLVGHSHMVCLDGAELAIIILCSAFMYYIVLEIVIGGMVQLHGVNVLWAMSIASLV
jgi:hypothetical protein